MSDVCSSRVSQEFSRLIGIPYSEMNCWDVAKEFYKDIFNTELKHYFDGPVPDREIIQDLIFTNKSDFVETKTPQFGDIVLIRVKGLESHIGIFINESQLLHTTKKTGCVIDRMAKWSKLISGFYTSR